LRCYVTTKLPFLPCHTVEKTASKPVQSKQYLSITCFAASWQFSACSCNNRVRSPSTCFGAFLSSPVFSFTKKASPYLYVRSLNLKKEKIIQKMAGILNMCSCIYSRSSKATANFRKTAVGNNASPNLLNIQIQIK